jgi:hypothetical protein
MYIPTYTVKYRRAQVTGSATRRFVKKAPNFVKKIAQNGTLLKRFITDKI